MAVLSNGYTFGTTEEVTAAKLHTLVSNATLSSIVNSDIDGSAAIAYSKLNLSGSVLFSDLAGSIPDSKLSQITTASKVSGAAITSLASVPGGAGILPVANIDVGTTASKVVQLTAAAKLPAVDGSLLTGIVANNFSSIKDYGSSASSSTARENSAVKMAFGSVAMSSGSVVVSNLSFTSSTSYTVLVSLDTAPGTQSQGITVARTSASSFTVTDSQSTNKIVHWIAIGT